MHRSDNGTAHRRPGGARPAHSCVMVRLPSDDLPPPHEPTSEVDALVAAGPPGPDNPVTVGAVFWTAVTEPDGPDLDILSIVVTPESWPVWGDFSRAAALLPGYG